MPLTLYMSVVIVFGCRCCCIVFLVLHAMCMLVFLNKLVMIRVSVPMYVNVTNFCFCGVRCFIVVHFCFYILV
jgi:hypothetical protein